jgi:anti-sigma regulatory factor (Ser/Thr protein kinase)
VARPGNSQSVDPDPLADVALVVARGRLPSDVAGELVDVLAEEHDIVVCDLDGMAAPMAASEVFAPSAAYLQAWPGTVVVACRSDPGVEQRLLSVPGAAHLVVSRTVEDGVQVARHRVLEVRRVGEQLAPRPTAARDARRFVARTLLAWELPRVVAPATLVASELVTNSVVHAVTVVDLTLTQAGQYLRIAVRDQGGGRPAARVDDPAGSGLSGRGLLIVHALTRSWGVSPGRRSGKTVWAVLDTTAPRERQVSS